MLLVSIELSLWNTLSMTCSGKTSCLKNAHPASLKHPQIICVLETLKSVPQCLLDSWLVDDVISSPKEMLLLWKCWERLCYWGQPCFVPHTRESPAHFEVHTIWRCLCLNYNLIFRDSLLLNLCVSVCVFLAKEARNGHLNLLELELQAAPCCRF